MALYLSNSAVDGLDVRLWNTQRLSTETDAESQIFAPAATPETVLNILSGQGQITVDGIVLGQQLITEGATAATDPLDAVARWVAEFEAWVNSEPPNAGYALRNDYVGDRENVTPRGLSWTRTQGERQSVQFTLDLEIGGDLGGDLGIAPASVSPGGVDRFDGIELPGVIERRVDKDVQLDVTPELLSETAANNVFQTDGAVKRVTIQGQVKQTLSEMQAFDDQFRSRIGDGEVYAFESAFPGDSFDAAILAYESTREAGLTRRGEYVLELVAGSVV